MNWREHTWEFVVATLSWIVALVALACLGVFVAVDVAKRRWAQRPARTMVSPTGAAHACLEAMELAS